MKAILSLSIIGLAMALSSLPASAREFVGPRGSTATSNTVVVPNAQGGYNGYRQGTVNGANGATGSSQVRFKTNGQGGAIYNGSSSTTTPNGRNINTTTSGSGNYDSTSGYSGQSTTTINGTTYNSTTQNGTTTITSPNGTRTINYTPRR
jgi:hypothetical protein